MRSQKNLFASIISFSALILMFSNCSKHDSAAAVNNRTWTVSTLAGNGTNLYLDGPDSSASFSTPFYIAADAAGNVYVSDESHQAIRKISGGQVTTVAGKGTGNPNPPFGRPYGVTVDQQNNLYDCEGSIIRKITPAGASSTFGGNGDNSGHPGYTDGQDTVASLQDVFKIIGGADGNFYFADYNSTPDFQIRKLVPGGMITTLAKHDNTGIYYYAGATSFDWPPSMTMDKAGNFYFTANSNTLIKKMDNKGNVTVFAGSTTAGTHDGKGSAAQFKHITSMAAGPDGHLFVVDYENNTIREVSTDGTVTTIAGQAGQGFKDGDAATAMFFRPFDIGIDGNGFLYISDNQNFRIRKMTFK
ncbi:MAG: hypothetical protein ABJB86_02785 [Bacteroidota bacterium]